MYNPNNFVNFGRQTKIVEVNGINGANAYSLAPNSNVILLDTSLPIAYIKSTDGNGYASVQTFDLVPHKDPVEVERTNLEERIKKLEAIVYESDNSTAKPKSTSNAKSSE